MSNQQFSDWIFDKLEQRGWSQAELARQGEFSPTTLSLILNSNRKPGFEVCCKIARAFHFPYEEVFKRAGLIPGVAELDDERLQWAATFNELSNADREELLAMAKFKISKNRKK